MLASFRSYYLQLLPPSFGMLTQRRTLTKVPKAEANIIHAAGFVITKFMILTLPAALTLTINFNK
ncbi:MAG: hypothetical protein ACTS4Z_00500 [Candidatus Hodgkinia cicadicola]